VNILPVSFRKGLIKEMLLLAKEFISKGEKDAVIFSDGRLKLFGPQHEAEARKRVYARPFLKSGFLSRTG